MGINRVTVYSQSQSVLPGPRGVEGESATVALFLVEVLSVERSREERPCVTQARICAFGGLLGIVATRYVGTEAALGEMYSAECARRRGLTVRHPIARAGISAPESIAHGRSSTPDESRVLLPQRSAVSAVGTLDYAQSRLRLDL